MKTALLAVTLLAAAGAARAQVKLPSAPESAPGRAVEAEVKAPPAPVDADGRYTGDSRTCPTRSWPSA